MLLLIVNVLLLVGAHAQSIDTFRLWGVIKFPVEGVVKLPDGNGFRDYSRIPADSCVHILVQEDVKCESGPYESCNIQESGRFVVRDLEVINGQVTYDVTPKYLDSQMYAISAVFNYHCTSNGAYKPGDYINTDHLSFQMKEGETEKNFDIKLDVIDEKEDKFLITTTTTPPTTPKFDTPTGERITAKHTVRGYLLLPEKGDYSKIQTSLLSCVHLQLYPKDFICNEGHCPDQIIWAAKIPVTNVVGFRMEYHLNIFELPKGEYLFRATMNIGWCSQTDLRSDILHQGDYYTHERHYIDLNKFDENHIYQKDLQLKAHQKYHCGDKMCYLKEKCRTDDVTNEKRCECMPYACPDLSRPQWVCANNGRTYSSECWMKASDCFSGTVYKVHKGRCGQGKHGRHHHHRRHHGKYVGIAMIAAAGIIFLVVVFAVISVIRKRAKKTGNRSYEKFTDEKITDMKSSALTFSVPDDEEKKAPENFYVFDPVKYVPRIEREVKKDAVYLEKVDYVKFDGEHQNEANA